MPRVRENPSVTELVDYEAFCGIGRGEQEAQEEKPKIEEITVEEFSAIRESDVVLVDVREPHEYDICSIEGSKLIPLGELKDRTGELDPEDDIVVHCHHGRRSMRAATFLAEQGFAKVRNLKGGIDEWAEKLDSEMARY